MTVPIKYSGTFLPVRYFLTSHRALSDGRSGVRHLEEQLQGSSFLLSEWKVIWIGTCAVLRSAIDLFQLDMKSCIAPRIREEVAAEWAAIRAEKAQHPIFWEFLRKERDNIIHEYEWAAYEAWIDPDGTVRPPSMSLLSVRPEETRSVLMMRGGHYEGRDSLELLKEGAEWVEARIFSAIRRAGYDPDESRNLVDFSPPPPPQPGTLGFLGMSDPET